MAHPFRTGKTTELAPYAAEHAETVLSWFYDYDYRFFFRDFSEAMTPEQFKLLGSDMAKSGVQLLVILDRETQKPIGLMTFALEKISAKIYKWGIMLDKDHQGKTWAIDAIIVLCDYLFHQLGSHKTVVEFCDADTHIHRITQKGGFLHEATLKEELFVDGTYFDEARYSLFKTVFDELYGNYLD